MARQVDWVHHMGIQQYFHQTTLNKALHAVGVPFFHLFVVAGASAVPVVGPLLALGYVAVCGGVGLGADRVLGLGYTAHLALLLVIAIVWPLPLAAVLGSGVFGFACILAGHRHEERVLGKGDNTFLAVHFSVVHLEVVERILMPFFYIWVDTLFLLGLQCEARDRVQSIVDGLNDGSAEAAMRTYLGTAT